MINTVCGTGSTGKICTEIAEVLKSEGHECIIGYGQGTTTYENAYKIGGKLENHLHNACSRLLGKQGYFSKKGTFKLIEQLKLEKPDVIHLHNLHGNYLHLDTLFDYLKEFQGKIVWTLHDCWAFTGKCAHYTDAKCFKWKSECFACPQYKQYPPSIFLDRTREMFADKKRWYNPLKIEIVTVSEWLRKEVAQSPILGGKKIHRIYNWVDSEVFKPGEINVEETKKILLISAFWNNDAAKTNRLLDFCNKLQSRFEITVVGKISDTNKENLNEVTFIEHISSSETLAELYSKADVYVHLSTEDTFGLVIAEAMSCGTPVVAFDSTACAEIVGSNACGEIINKEQSPVEAVIKILSVDKERYSQNCRKSVLENFNKPNIQKYIDLYQ